MNGKHFLSAILLMACSSVVHATSVTWSGVPTARTAVDHNLTTLSTSSLVWAGTFSNPNGYTFNSSLTISANVSNFISSSGWKQFTLDPATGLEDNSPFAVLNTLGVNASGKIAGTVSDNNGEVGSGLQASFFDNKGAYLWIFNAPTVGAATEMGIFRATTATVPWIFPTNGNGSGDVLTLSSTAGAASVIAAIGGAGVASSSRFQLVAGSIAPVPEPSTFTFGLLTGLAALYGRRRRN